MLLKNAENKYQHVTNKEVVFRLMDGRKVSIAHPKDNEYIFGIKEKKLGKWVLVVSEKIISSFYDGKIATFRKIMEEKLADTTYEAENAEVLRVRSLETDI